MTGQTISHYRILKKLGQGGMGQVFRAEDTRLGRQVAIKLLSGKFAENREHLERFQREARTASALNHPGICTIYDIGQYERQPFIVMECLQGQDLKSFMGTKPLTARQILRVAIQVADALQSAHSRGIIHRDIKPANVFLTQSGQAKILDFGLAKLQDAVEPPADSSLSNMETRMAPSNMLTTPGTTMGTVAYMSPEQARGEEVDARTDVFSFGVMLYEMATGAVPFGGKSTALVFDGILNRQPASAEQLNPSLPPGLASLIERALEKDPELRYQTASDLRADLKRIDRNLSADAGSKLGQPTPAEGLSASEASARSGGGYSRTWIIGWTILALVPGLALLYQAFSVPDRSAAPILEPRLTQLSVGNGLTSSPTWSPDGGWIAFAMEEKTGALAAQPDGGQPVSNLDLWKIKVEGGDPIRLTQTPANESQPAWSPDGRIIAFASDQEQGGLFLIPSEGGSPLQLTEFGRGPVWSPQGESLAFDWQGGLYLVSARGGQPQQLLGGNSAPPFPAFSPDGKRILFWNRTQGDIHVVPVAGGESRPLGLIRPGEEVSGIAWSQQGDWMVFSRGPFGGKKDLWKVRLDPGTGLPSDVASPIAVTPTDDAECAFSHDGRRIAYVVRQFERHLWRLPLNPSTGLASGKPSRLTSASKNNYYPALSPDGVQMVWTSHRAGNGMLYYQNLAQGVTRKVTQEWGRAVREVGGSFESAGGQIFYSSTLGGSYQIWRIPSVSSVALPITRTSDPVRDSLTSFCAASGRIYFYSNRSGNWDIWSISLQESEPRPLTQWPGNELYPACSPDGGRIALSSNREGNPDIWEIRLETGEARPLVSHPATESWAGWSEQGRLYFSSNRSGSFNIWMKEVGQAPGLAVTAYQGHSFGLPDSGLYTRFAVGGDGLILPLEERSGEIHILDHFH